MKPEFLELQPHELKFIFELKKQSSSSVQMINKTNQYVAFKIKTTNPKKYCVRPNAGVIDPNASCDFSVTMQAPKVAPPDMICRDKFLVQSTIVSEGTKEEDVTSSMFAKADGKVVDEKKLKVIFVSRPNSPEVSPIDGTIELVDNNKSKELKADTTQQNSSHPMVIESMEVSKGDGESIEVTRKEEPLKRKEESLKRKEAVEKIEEPVKLMQESTKRNEESLKRKEAVERIEGPVKPIQESTKRNEESLKRKEAVERIEESVRPIQEYTKINEEPLKRKEAVGRIEEPLRPIQEHTKRSAEVFQINDTNEQILAKDVEEMKSKLKELESKLNEARATILHLTEEKRSVTQEKHFLQGELDLVRSKRHRAQAGFPLLFVFMVGLVSLYLGYLLHR